MAKKISSIKKIIKVYIEILKSKGIHVETVILYGSQATGFANDDSDIDIIIISDDLKLISFPERLGFLSQATLNIPEPLEVIGYTRDEVKNKNGKSVFWDEICSKGKIIYTAA
ncbi:MAG: nucleotidyltransferase domain-containing protein [Pseudomonadota bacterium]